MTKNKAKTVASSVINDKPLVKFITVAIIACGVAGLGLAIHANYMPPYTPHTRRFVIENISLLCIIAEVVLAYALKRLQQGVYWFNWLQLQRPVLDERQRQVRQQVFERAYTYSLIMLLATVLYVGSRKVEYALFVPGNYNLLVRIMWTTGVLAVSLPSILAAWRKNS